MKHLDSPLITPSAQCPAYLLWGKLAGHTVPEVPSFLCLRGFAPSLPRLSHYLQLMPKSAVGGLGVRVLSVCGGGGGTGRRGQGSWSLAVEAKAWHRLGVPGPPSWLPFPAGVPDHLCHGLPGGRICKDGSYPSLLVILNLSHFLLPSPEVPPCPRINLQPGPDS